MSEPSTGQPEALALAQRIDQVCDRFEEAWLAGRRPRLEEYLLAVSEEGRPALLRELLPLEIAYRRQGGETPQLSDYQGRFPELDVRCLTPLVDAPSTAPPPSPPPPAPPSPGGRDDAPRPPAQGGNDREHNQADKPVSANSDPLTVRAGRWARRHKPMISAAATAALVGLFAVAAGAWWHEREQRRRQAEQAQLHGQIETALAEVVRLQTGEQWAAAAATLQEARRQLKDLGPCDLAERLGQLQQNLDLVVRLDGIRQQRRGGHLPTTDNARANMAYAAAFAQAGLGSVGDEPALVAERVTKSPVRLALLAALADWLVCVPKEPSMDARRTWLWEVVRRADPAAARRAGEQDRAYDPRQ
jgi:hypothetical protein